MVTYSPFRLATVVRAKEFSSSNNEMKLSTYNGIHDSRRSPDR